MRNGLLIFSSVFLTIGIHASLTAAESKVLLSSKVATDGDFLTLPVEIDGKEYSFAVDTGAPISAFNKSFMETLDVFDESMKPVRVRDGMRSQFYRAPSMTITGTESGSLPFPRFSLVACIDMSDIQKASDQQIDGILGLDFLSNYALELDLSVGSLRFLDPISLAITEHDGVLETKTIRQHVWVVARSGKAEYLALVDTGALCTIDLQREVYEHLLEKGKLARWSVEGIIEGEKQVRTSHQGWLIDLSLGPFTHYQLVAGIEEDYSILGLFYWKRYRVTFDFSRNRIYLQKNPLFAMFDDSYHAGIWIEPDKEDARTKVVTYVAKTSYADHHGVQIGDRLVSIDGKGVEESSLHNIFRRLLNRHQRECELRFQRDDKSFVITLPATGDMPDLAYFVQGKELSDAEPE